MEILKAIKRRFIRRQEYNSGESMVQETGLSLSYEDRLRQLIRAEMFRQHTRPEAESFAEADDFDLPGEVEWVSPYENDFDPEPAPTETAPTSAPAEAPPPAPSVTSAPPVGDNNGSPSQA